MTLPPGFVLDSPKGFRASPDLLHRQEMQESGGNPNAVSPKGAFGLRQIMPETARDPGFGVKPFDFNAPDQKAENRRMGTDYLNAMLNRYGGDTETALVAYNWGPGNADKWAAGGKDYSKLPEETRGYLRNIMGGRTQQAEFSPDPTAPTMGAMRAPQLPPGYQIDSLPPGFQLDAPGPKLSIEVEQPGQMQASMAGAPAVSLGGTLQDFNTGLGQGLTAGFKDELFAGMAAPFRAGARAITGGDEGKGIGERFSGAYEIELENQRRMQREAEARSPIATGVGETAGAVMSMASPAGRAQSWLGAMGRGGGVGAVYGGLYGFGSGEGVEDRLSQAKTGGVIGGSLGMAAPAALSGVKAAAGPVARTVRSLIASESEAARRVATAVAKDRTLGQGLTPQQVIQARQQGQPIANIDAGGETTRALARSAANQSPEARAALDRMVNDRFEGQGDRVTNWLRSRTRGPGDASATREDLLDRSRRANKAAYAKAYSDGSKGIWTPELERLSGSPDVLAAMKSAANTGKSRSINDGFGAFNPGVEISETGIVNFTKGRQGAPTYPDLRYWDYVKRELDDAASAARRAGRVEEAGRIGGQARLLRDELDNAVPAYRAARQGAAAFFQADDALEAGSNFVNLNVDLNAARRAVAKMNPAERALFEEGFVSSLLDRVSKVGDRANVVQRIWGNPKVREQIKVALGPTKAREFETFMAVETIMDLPRSALQGNSTTVRQLAEMGLAGTVGGFGSGLASGSRFDATTGIVTALTWGAGRRGLAKVDEGVAKRVADLLVSSDPKQFLRGVQAVTNSKNMMASMRSFIGALATAGAVQYGAGQPNAGAE